MTLPGKGRRLLPLLASAAVCLALVLAAAAAPQTARAETAPGPLQADVVLLLDRSGSMAKNDPAGLGATGAAVVLNMLDPADRVAVVAFDTTARTLLPLAPVGDGSAARKALGALGKPTGEWTDIKGALQAALDLLGQGQSGRQGAVLLFTDGKPETRADGVPPGYREEMAGAVSRLAGRNIPVFSVGLGQADFETLGQIAQGTKAESFAASSPGQIVQLFTDVLSRIKERQVVLSFSEDLAPGVAGQPHTFQVPPYTRLLTLSGVGAGGVRLKGQMPGGGPLEAAPGLKVSRGGNYSVYTIASPAPGTWTVQLEGAGRVEAHGQTESALRLQLISPQPYSQVESGKSMSVSVEVAGDPDPQSPLEVWAQAGAGEAVRLDRVAGPRYEGAVPVGDGRLAVWAARAGGEVARREFRLYPMVAAAPGQGQAQPPAPSATAGGQAGAARRSRPAWLAAAAVALAAALLALGTLRWRRLRRSEEALAGRLGSHSLAGRGRVQPIGDVATLEARLVPLGPAALAGLGLVRRQLRIYIRPGPGVRLQINGRPPGDGRLYHGDEVTLGGETYVFQNPQMARRPVKASGVPRRTGPGRRPGNPHTTIKG
jgi:Mg-chelatase subunit ChlD